MKKNISLFAIFIIIFWSLGLSKIYAQKYWPIIGKGINLDFTTTEVNKIGYSPAYYDAFKDAGFESVRIFVKQGNGPEQYKEAIDGALERELTVVIAGFTGRTNGKQNFIDYWDSFGEYYKEYPKELVFEIMNEPKMAGHPNEYKYDVEVMQWLGDAIVAIRKTNATRVIAIGGTHNNHADMLVKYVNPTYLTYKLEDGSGFEEDQNIWGIFHNYRPHGWTHNHKTTDLNLISPHWKNEINEALNLGELWSKTYNKKIVMSEWGAKLTSNRKDILDYITYMTKESAKRNIDWMYYCGVFNNAWTFSLYNSEYGFDKNLDIVKVLTGKTPSSIIKPTNQINNSSFSMDSEHWYSNGQVTLNTVESEGVNGSRALRCMVSFTFPNEPIIFQQTTPQWRFYSDGFYMLQLRKGNTYTVSLHAKASTNKTKLEVQLSDEGKQLLWSSKSFEINNELTKYEFTYTHKDTSVDNARFSIIFSDRHSEVILDEIKLIGKQPEL